MFKYREYAFIDVIDHLYEEIMNEADIRISNVRESIKNGTPYRLIFCMIFGIQEERFMKALSCIRNKALLLGYKDYDMYCSHLEKIGSVREG
jgi:hypothetical protein